MRPATQLLPGQPVLRSGPAASAGTLAFAVHTAAAEPAVACSVHNVRALIHECVISIWLCVQTYVAYRYCRPRSRMPMGCKSTYSAIWRRSSVLFCALSCWPRRSASTARSTARSMAPGCKQSNTHAHCMAVRVRARRLVGHNLQRQCL